jgi:nifR3 family TIM-barrel protein
MGRVMSNRRARVVPRSIRHTGGVSGLRLGEVEISPPVVLAPMAGITNRAYRRLCREAGAGLYVSEMITSRALVERNAATLEMIRFDADESPRSLQLYGVDPDVVARAVGMVVEEDLADHVDLNFGCPVPKVTRKGGGSALPWKRDLFAAIVQAAVRSADGKVPVTVKMRLGIDDNHLTYLDAGRIAADAGVAWVALHGRTAAQLYSGNANWDHIARLVEHLPETPVLGNGDIFSAQDALRMMSHTGCAGVVIGRGCLGRPWLFGQLAAAFANEPIPPDPDLVTVLATLRRHAELLVEAFGELTGCREIRKHMAWYLKGYVVRRHVRAALGTVESLAQLDLLLSEIDPDQEADTVVMSAPRGRTGSPRPPALPEGWLDSPHLSDQGIVLVRQAELSVSGG